MRKITIECCGGKRGSSCIKESCPIYRLARSHLENRTPYVGTGFGNLYHDPNHDDILNQVRKDLAEDQDESGFTLCHSV